jgi:hypothetical protein
MQLLKLVKLGIKKHLSIQKGVAVKMVEIWHMIWVPSSPGLLLGLCREVIYIEYSNFLPVLYRI